ncbi:hypothetical protein N2152v2_003821 [Parachlorella kessleri]
MTLRAGVLLLYSVLLLLHARPVLPQQCGSSPERVVPSGGNDDSGFLGVENDPSAGTIFMVAGVYKIGRSITLRKPVSAAKGAVFQVADGITLTLYNQPQHPYSEFFRGPGKVAFASAATGGISGVKFAVPEWWGAKADGRADDSEAIQRAYEAALTGAVMLYLRGSYGIGPARQLLFAPGVAIMAEDSARFVAIGGNTRGIRFTTGNMGVRAVLPHLDGFRDYCAELEGLSVAALHFRVRVTLANCGDAIRFRHPGSNQVLDNTVWFDKIVNSQVGIAFRAAPGCGLNCIFQGNHIVGGTISGRGANQAAASYAILLDSPTGGLPSWDSNNVGAKRGLWDIAGITPPSRGAYRVVSASPQCDRELIKIHSLGKMPPGALVFEGRQNQMSISLQLAAPLAEYQLGLQGLLNMVDLSGPGLVPASGKTPVRCTLSSNSKRSFNGGRALVGSYNILQAVPDSAWPSGESRVFYFYHQLAQGDTYSIKCNSRRTAAGLPEVDCIQFFDNHAAVWNEVQIRLINQSGRTLAAGSINPFSIAYAAVGSPPAVG